MKLTPIGSTIAIVAIALCAPSVSADPAPSVRPVDQCQIAEDPINCAISCSGVMVPISVTHQILPVSLDFFNNDVGVFIDQGQAGGQFFYTMTGWSDDAQCLGPGWLSNPPLLCNALTVSGRMQELVGLFVAGEKTLEELVPAAADIMTQC